MAQNCISGQLHCLTRELDRRDAPFKCNNDALHAYTHSLMLLLSYKPNLMDTPDQKERYKHWSYTIVTAPAEILDMTTSLTTTRYQPSMRSAHSVHQHIRNVLNRRAQSQCLVTMSLNTGGGRL